MKIQYTLTELLWLCGMMLTLSLTSCSDDGDDGGGVRPGTEVQSEVIDNNTSQWTQTKDSANTGSSTVANGVMTIISSGSSFIQRQIYSNKTATALLDIKNGQTYTASIEMMVTEASTGTAIADLRVNNTDNSTSNKIRITQDLSKLKPNVWTKVQSTSKITYDEKTFNYWRF